MSKGPMFELTKPDTTWRDNRSLIDSIYRLRRWCLQWTLDPNIRITIECATDEQKYAMMDCLKRGFRFDTQEIVPGTYDGEGFCKVLGIPLKITSTKERTKW